jgi:hypothetical protein
VRHSETRAPSHGVLFGAYVGWIASCVMFFALGIVIGRLIPGPATRGEDAQSAQTSPAPVAELPSAIAGAQYAVRVAVVATADEANRIARSLNERGFTSAYITRPSSDEAQPTYKINVGFYNLPTANQVAEELRRDFGYRSAQVIGN